jgi:hypothetical protein
MDCKPAVVQVQGYDCALGMEMQLLVIVKGQRLAELVIEFQ